ncbi:hypothetical protein M8494_29535 [Serratia ureilytica]
MSPRPNAGRHAPASDGKVTLSANGKGDDALHLRGAPRSAAAAPRSRRKTAASCWVRQNEQHKDNWSLGIKANAKGGQTFSKDASGKVTSEHRQKTPIRWAPV